MELPVEIPVDQCRPSPNARPISDIKVEILMRSIREVGHLIQPITVRRLDGDAYEIRGGGHRHAAHVRLGRTTILAFVRELDDLRAELVEIDENLIRNDLSAAERDIAIARRKAIYEELHPETKHGATGRGRPKNRVANVCHSIEGDDRIANVCDSIQPPAERFTKATAKDIGLAERTVRLSVSRVERIGAETLSKVVGTSLDRGDEIDALAKLEPDHRERLIARAAAGEDVSAKRGEKDILAAAKEIRARDRKERFDQVNERLAKISEGNAPLPTGRKYPIIYADPATKYVSGFGDRSIENHYPTMTTEELCALPVSDLATKDAVLFIWSTVPQLRNTMSIIEAWGFKYVSEWCWDKVRHGTGHWGFNQHELLLIASRGDFPAPVPGTQPRSLYREEKGEHSAKPAWFAEQIERIWPVLPKIELFTRSPRDGWAVWGNQAEGKSDAGVAASIGTSNVQFVQPETAIEPDENPPGATVDLPENFRIGAPIAPSGSDLDIPDFLKRDSNNVPACAREGGAS